MNNFLVAHLLPLLNLHKQNKHAKRQKFNNNILTLNLCSQVSLFTKTSALL